MPLIRHEIVGHDQERLAFRFSMLNDGQVVLCQISDAALDELAGMKGTESGARMAQFLSLRQTIEQTASRLFDEGPGVPGAIVKIFSKHVSRRPDEIVAAKSAEAANNLGSGKQRQL
jgi:hypothetical protein